MKRFLLWFILFPLFILEFQAFFAVESFRSKVPSVLEKLELSHQLDKSDKPVWLELSPNPYFGFTNSRRGKGRNNFGFLSPVNYPYKKGEKEYVIALMGGNFAHEVYRKEKNEHFLSQTLEKLSFFNEKKVTILDFTLPYGKQPQHYGLFSYFIDSFDMVIEISGLNDLEMAAKIHTGFPLEFPIHSEHLFSYKINMTRTLAELATTRAHLRQFIDLIESPYSIKNLYVWRWLQMSQFDFLTDRLQTLVDRKRRLERQIETKSFQRIPSSEIELAKRSYQIWQRFSELTKKLALANQKPHLLFLSPGALNSAQVLAHSNNHPIFNLIKRELSRFSEKNQDFYILKRTGKKHWLESFETTIKSRIKQF